ncbi:MAG: phosphatidylglycerophosphatase A [bacterium]
MIRILKMGFITGLGTGYVPIAPATFACFIGIVLWYFLVDFPFIYWAVFLTLFIWGLTISQEFVKEWGKDPRKIVVDEYAAILIPLYFVPKKILPLCIAFVLFRVFDVIKPPPLRQLEKLSGAWGIMFDDVGAAVYTTIIVIIIRFFFII